MKRDKILFYVFTGLFSLLMLGGVSQYIFNYDHILGAFEKLQFPTWLVYPMAIAKTSGIATIWFIKSDTLKQWAYAGFTFNLMLAVGAHLSINDNEFMGAGIALILLLTSYAFYTRLKKAA